MTIVTEAGARRDSEFPGKRSPIAGHSETIEQGAIVVTGNSEPIRPSTSSWGPVATTISISTHPIYSGRWTVGMRFEASWPQSKLDTGSSRVTAPKVWLSLDHTSGSLLVTNSIVIREHYLSSAWLFMGNLDRWNINFGYTDVASE
ncbi:hypothetical protein BDY19DRAFT_904621 [Irpex rosettiformis]|uniref:Uncharacterized protein n=1 Tax=Irpex rosettiformis TaxID=378272 RepID=A0ACB8U9S6_9APHY|nr:hypothetical protein BDY19DRAFT_904621 [Irpex rosettiformis]